MGKRYIVVGAGGFGRELALAVEVLIACEGGELIGFLDDNESPLGSNSGKYPPVLGRPRDFAHSTEYTLLLGVADPIPKMSLVRDVESRGGKFGTFIHPRARVQRTSTIGHGCVICEHAGASADAVLGDFVLLNTFSGVAHDCVVGAGTTVSSFVDICGHAEIGAEVFIGSHACLIPGVRVGDRARIGAGSIVIRNVKASQVVYQPAAKSIQDET